MSDVFVRSVFDDGDKDWDAPKWRNLIDNELIESDEINHSKEQKKHMRIAENEIGLKHPISGAVVKLKDDGSLEMFVNEDTGLRMNPVDNSIVFYGDSIHIAAKEINMHTKKEGFVVNEKVLNPEIIEHGNNLKFEGLNNKNYSIFKERKSEAIYDTHLKNVLSKMGLEVKYR